MKPPINWINVSASRPCPICERPDWCAISDDGRFVACRRVESPQSETRQDSAGGEFYFYKMEGGGGSAATSEGSAASAHEARTLYTERTDCAKKQRSAPNKESATAVAPAEDLSRVYAYLLSILNLTETHKNALRARGHSDEQIARHGYKTLPPRDRSAIAKTVVERFGEDLTSTIPGFYLKSAPERNARYWSLAGAAGILIPIRDGEGRITALQIRLDEPGESGKYQFLSSKKHGGASAGAPLHTPYTPLIKQCAA